MADLRLFSSTSNLIRFTLKNSSTGMGLTGLTNASSGLIISTIADVESSATAYTVAGATIDTITTLGTYAAPTAGHCRFKEVDSTNHKGLYEFQFADARFAVTNAKRLVISVTGAASLLDADYEIELVQFNPFDGVRLGLTAFPNVASGNAGALLVDGTGTAAISNSGGKVLLQATQAGVTIPTVTTVTNQLTAAQIATGIFQDTTAGDFTVAGSIGKSLFTSGNAPGVAGGLALVGSNVGTVTSVSGSVGSVTGNVGGNVTGSVGSIAAGGISNASFAADTGKVTVRSGTAQAGAATTITLDAGASATTNYYINDIIYLTGGTGAGQARFCTAYNGTTKVATVQSAWATDPDATTTFAIIPFDSIPGATAPTAAQVATAVWQDLTAGSDFGTAGSIGALLKTDIDATISSRGTGTALTATQVENAVWDGLTASHATAGSFGLLVKTDLDAAISSRMATFTLPTNFAALAITAGGAVTAGTVSDKTGYSLTQAFPSNFAALGITAGGAVTVDGTSPLTESYTTGAFTLAQALYEIAQVVGQNSTSGTTITVQKRDKVSVAATFTVDSNAAPTLRTRAT